MSKYQVAGSLEAFHDLSGTEQMTWRLYVAEDQRRERDAHERAREEAEQKREERTRHPRSSGRR